MEHIGNPLDRLKARIEALSTLPVSEKQVLTEAECPYRITASDCLSCDDFTKTINGNRTLFLTAACKAKQLHRIMVAKSGLFGKDVDETFAAANIDRHNGQLYRYLQHEWDRRRWLYIYNPKNGTGKSYTANAIANMLISEGIQPLVIREIDMASQLQASFNDDTGDSEYALMGKYKAVQVLIIQDLGKQGCRSEWWPQKIYDIIDHRLIKGFTTVFTSNHDLTDRSLFINKFGDNHGPAIYSRLMGACEIWELGGPDRRFATVGSKGA